ncbi:MAG TPA: DUF4340 domain-containing protein [Candidatus Dormibacteraeota bacterium]|nr:DUF4340 domain-containing protein [Candidatus Dormibacteraeota bacterium]
MTNWKGAAVLGAVLVALAVYAFATRQGPATPPPVVLLPCVPGQTVEFKLAGSDGKVMDARRASPAGAWQLVAPAGPAADGTAVDDLVFAAESIAPTATINRPPASGGLGLDPPSQVVTCALQGGRSYTLSIGGQNFDGSGYYARVGVNAKLYVIPSAPVVKFRGALDNPPVAPSPSPSGSPSPSPST